VQPTGDLARWRWEGVECRPFEPTYFLGRRRVEPRAVPAAELDQVVVVARGGADNKGQHLSNILGALDAARAGTLAWRVRIVLDGEEEHGSPHLEAIARAHRARLAADVLIGSDGPKPGDQPALVMGVRGLLMVDLVAENGQPASLHSGNYGNIVPNPVLPLARLIEDIEGRVAAYAEAHTAFRQEAEAVFARVFGGTLRTHAAPHLAAVPTPLGFHPRAGRRDARPSAAPHGMGADRAGPSR